MIKKMNRIAAVCTAAVLAASALAGCGASGAGASSAAASTAAETSAEAKDEKKLSVVTTIFPEYDWVKEILGDRAADVELTMLLDNGVDLHSYQPTAEDIMKIANCDLFVYVGGESDGWVADALREATNKDMRVVNLLESLGEDVKEEELVEGMQEGEHHHDHAHEGEEADHDHDHHHEHEGEEADHDHDHEHEGEEADHDHDHEHEGEEADHDHDHDHEQEGEEVDHDHDHHHEHGEVEYDEHVWLSLKNAEALCAVIAEALTQLDPEHAESYRSNLESYTEKLEALDQEYRAAVNGASAKTLVFGDRFPFRYLVDDYGLDYYAAFVGCSAETEASFETITFLSQKVDELGLKNVMTIEGPEHKIAETIVKNTQAGDQEILTLDSMQATKAEDVAAGTTYLSVMTKNLEVLKQALQ
ncbi:MAG: metal ABC transporter substrate-binding protein [Stomatobaculum sp.]